MDCATHQFVFPRTVILGDDHRGTGGKTGKKSDHQIDNCRRASADSGQSCRSNAFADDNRVHGIVQLLKQHAKKDGKEKLRQFSQDTSLR